MKEKLFFSTIFFALFILSCSKQEPAEKTKIYLNLKKMPSQARPLSTLSALSALSSRGWGLTPSSLADFDCFGVLISETIGGFNQGTCKNSSGDLLAFPQIITGMVASGSTIVLTIPAGPDVRFQVVGLMTNSSCPNLSGIFQASAANFSAPHILSDDFFNIVPGTQNLTIPISFSSDLDADNCFGGPFPGSSSGNSFWDNATWNVDSWDS